MTALKAIKTKCLDCCGGERAEVKKCTVASCALFAFRDGHNPNRKGMTSEQKSTKASHLNKNKGEGKIAKAAQIVTDLQSKGYDRTYILCALTSDLSMPIGTATNYWNKFKAR